MASPAPSQLKPAVDGSLAPNSFQARRCFPVFLICGMLVSFLGAILPAWGYHMRDQFGEVGDYFLSLNFGFLLATAIGQRLLPAKGLKYTLILGNILATAGLLFLAFYSAATMNRFGGVADGSACHDSCWSRGPQNITTRSTR